MACSRPLSHLREESRVILQNTGALPEIRRLICKSRQEDQIEGNTQISFWLISHVCGQAINHRRRRVTHGSVCLVNQGAFIKFPAGKSWRGEKALWGGGSPPTPPLGLSNKWVSPYLSFKQGKGVLRTCWVFGTYYTCAKPGWHHTWDPSSVLDHQNTRASHGTGYLLSWWQVIISGVLFREGDPDFYWWVLRIIYHHRTRWVPHTGMLPRPGLSVINIEIVSHFFTILVIICLNLTFIQTTQFFISMPHSIHGVCLHENIIHYLSEM